MAWSYRQDRSDEIYSDQVGVSQVAGEKLPHTPRSVADAEEMLKGDKKEVAKDAKVTEHQRHPGDNVPRTVDVEDEGDNVGRPFNPPKPKEEQKPQANEQEKAADKAQPQPFRPAPTQAKK